MKEKELPIAVRRTLGQLRELYPHYVAIKVIKQKFYAFEVTTRRDPITKKTKTRTRYLGAINADGTFNIAKHREKPKALEEETPIEENKVSALEQISIKVRSEEAKILRALSMNSRISLSHLSKLTGINETNIDYWFKKTEKKFGLKYIAEIDVENLGYLEYIVLVKFNEEIPKLSELKEAIEKQGRIQLAALVHGEYDLLLYVYIEKSREARSEIYEMREAIAPGYNSAWYLVPFYSTYGFIPLRNEFFEGLKSKDGILLKREFSVLKELNKNANINFTDIDKNYGFDTGRSDYTFNRLKETGRLKGTTITIGNTNVRYIAVILIEKDNQNLFTRTREQLIKEIIQETDAYINKYILVGDIEIPDGILLTIPVFSETDLKTTLDRLNRYIKGIKLKTLILTDMLVGEFCYRLFDNEHSHQREILSYKYGMPAPKKIAYHRKPRSIKRQKGFRGEKNIL